jgi:hypothetical protein
MPVSLPAGAAVLTCVNGFPPPVPVASPQPALLLIGCVALSWRPMANDDPPPVPVSNERLDRPPPLPPPLYTSTGRCLAMASLSLTTSRSSTWFRDRMHR